MGKMAAEKKLAASFEKREKRREEKRSRDGMQTAPMLFAWPFWLAGEEMLPLSFSPQSACIGPSTQLLIRNFVEN